MARKTKTRDLSPTLEPAAQWIRRCLIEDGSILSPRGLWTADLLRELETRFVKAPDSSDRKFLAKLKDQLANASPEARCLMAEVLWILSLFPSATNMKPETKRARVLDFWAMLPSPSSQPALSDAALVGIGSVGQGYLQHQPLEAESIITMALNLKGRSVEERKTIFATRTNLEEWLNSQPRIANRQFPNVLRYFAFPDEVERISSVANKRAILEGYGVKVGADWPHQRLDDEILTLRTKMEALHPGQNLDFYEAPLVDRWKEDRENSDRPVISTPVPVPVGPNKAMVAAPHLNVRDQLAVNRIYFGPPGTGKTHKLRSLFAAFEDEPRSASRQEWLRSIVADHGWRAVIAVSLSTSKEGMKVPDLLRHELMLAKIDLRGRSANLSQTAWGYLCEHTPPDSKTVQNKIRRAPFIFDKSVESRWELLAGWEEADSEAAALSEVYLKGPASGAASIRRYRTVTFHPSYCYEDFVRGIRPIATEDAGRTEFRMVDGVFKQICDEARANPAKRYALFIDEINRGNIAKIFGELITLIEPDKRLVVTEDGSVVGGMTVQLPGSNTGEAVEPPFGVPANLDLYGTMNTADRSIALLDIALRRRFEFVELPPRYDADIFTSDVADVDRGALLRRINDRLEYLLDRDHRIGHAYLMKANSLAELRGAFANQIIPLLQEYFFDDLGKVALTLSGPDGTSPFVRKEELGYATLFTGRAVGSPSPRFRYLVTDPAQWSAEAFQSIYASTGPATDLEAEDAAG